MQFEMKVLRRGEGVSLLSIAAMNESDAASLAKNQGYTVLGIKSGGSMALPRFKKSGNGFPLVLFSQELLALIDAGLSLVEALETLAEKERHSEAKKVFDAIVARLYEGQPLSTALQDFPAVFPPLFVATIRTSEKTGGLSEALGRFVTYQSQLDFVRKKIISASIYPVLLMLVGGLVIVFLMTYVVPKFAVIYEGGSANLPVLSQLLLQWGTLLKTHGLMVLFVVLGFIQCGLWHHQTSCQSMVHAKAMAYPRCWRAYACLSISAFLPNSRHAHQRWYSNCQRTRDGVWFAPASFARQVKTCFTCHQ
jgi:general secretion pathway protein F